MKPHPLSLGAQQTLPFHFRSLCIRCIMDYFLAGNDQQQTWEPNSPRIKPWGWQ